MTNEFNVIVARFKSEVRRRVRGGTDLVSAVDFRNVMRTKSGGSSRGSIVRRAFSDLVNEGLLTPTRQSVYNTDTRHRVTVYRAL